MVSDIEPVSGCLKALADPTRLAIVGRLQEGELSVHEVAEQFPMSRPAISKHLKILREAGLVSERSEGRARIYSIDLEPLTVVQSWLSAFGASGTERRSRPTGVSRSGRTAAPRAKSTSAGDWRVW